MIWGIWASQGEGPLGFKFLTHVVHLTLFNLKSDHICHSSTSKEQAGFFNGFDHNHNPKGGHQHTLILGTLCASAV